MDEWRLAGRKYTTEAIKKKFAINSSLLFPQFNEKLQLLPGI
jgi:hypothetical protein